MVRVLAILVLVAAVAVGVVALRPLPDATPGSSPVPVTLDPVAPGPVVLRVSGASGDVALSLADLEALGLRRVATSTFWPDDDGVYEGPLLADLLRHAGIGDAPAIRVSAVDGFSQVIPREDWTRWPVLVATRRDGKAQTVREKGPIRIIYPRDMDPTLSDTVYRLRWVWLVTTIEPAAS